MEVSWGVSAVNPIDSFKNNVESRNVYKVDLKKDYRPVNVNKYADSITNSSVLDTIKTKWPEYVDKLRGYINETNSSVVREVYSRNLKPTQFNYYNSSLNESIIGRNINVTV